jgi:hypothetical protein
MKTPILHDHACFFTNTYGAYRWHDLLGKPGCWYVVALNIELAQMQGVSIADVHFKAVVDDFGNLVRVS